MRTQNTKYLHAIIIFYLTISIAGAAYPYTADDNIILNCGTSGNSPSIDRRTWIGDTNSKFFSAEFTQNSASVTLKSTVQSPSVSPVPYITARLSRSEFTYSFPVTPGQKFIRLYFYPSFYPNFDRDKSLFSVKTGRFTLLKDFNASVNADANGEPKILREFCVNSEGHDQRLNLTFIPSDSDSYAFVNGIEIVSMPTDLYYRPVTATYRGPEFIGQEIQYFPLQIHTAVEMAYRINVGGGSISSIDDTGMFRTWSPEGKFLTMYTEDASPFDTTSPLKWNIFPNYTAPENVYRTSRTMGRNKTINKSYNLTWEFPVDSGFPYMVRLHFCEFDPLITQQHDREFLIFLADLLAEGAADVIQWAGKQIPYYRDYVVFMPDGNNDKKVNLSVKLEANPQDFKTSYNDAILNGIEIFKLNDTRGNLAGKNPDPPPNLASRPPMPASTEGTNSKRKATVLVAGIVGGVVFCVVVVLLLGFIIFRRGRGMYKKDQSSGDGGSWWGPFSFSTTKSTKTRGSSLPSDLCQYFSFAEIKAATNNFNEVFIVGVGGFGNVYKGYINIDGGSTSTPVAIKRLKPGSEQGAHEFKTEIEMLSQLRHLHLVSLIGYCNVGNEKILIYDYMTRGTLRDHLYGGDNPPLSWNQRLQICIGAARGLHYLHTGAKYTIIHRDVKTTNILLDEKWVAKVSDFGLSKVGPTSMSKAHVSTVVKGSFGYLDPEYYRRQQLTEKSDVYSFGVVLCEVLCGRPPLMRTRKKDEVSLAEWVRKNYTQNTLDQIIDQNLKNQVAPDCLKKFGEIAVSCIHDNGAERPSMSDVVWGLEFALQLQESAVVENKKIDGAGDDDDEAPILKPMAHDRNDDLFSESSGVIITTSSDGSSGQSLVNVDSNKGLSGLVFSEVMNSKGR